MLVGAEIADPEFVGPNLLMAEWLLRQGRAMQVTA